MGTRSVMAVENKKVKIKESAEPATECTLEGGRLSEQCEAGVGWMGRMGGAEREQINSLRGFSCGPISGHSLSAPNLHP